MLEAKAKELNQALQDLFKEYDARSCQDLCVSVCVRGAYRSCNIPSSTS